MDGISITFPPSCFRLIVWEISSCPDVESHKAGKGEDTWDEDDRRGQRACAYQACVCPRSLLRLWTEEERAVLMDKVVEMMRVRPRPTAAAVLVALSRKRQSRFAALRFAHYQFVVTFIQLGKVIWHVTRSIAPSFYLFPPLFVVPALLSFSECTGASLFSSRFIKAVPPSLIRMCVRASESPSSLPP